MPGNAAGLSRAHRQLLLTTGQDTAALTWALGFQPGWEARGFKSHKWQFFTSGVVTGLSSVTLYGTVDPNTARGTATNWFILDAPTDQAGTGAIQNPITAFDGSQTMNHNGSLEAWRIVVGSFTGGGSVVVDWECSA